MRHFQNKDSGTAVKTTDPLFQAPRRIGLLYRLNRFSMANLHSLAAIGVVALLILIILNAALLVKVW